MLIKRKVYEIPSERLHTAILIDVIDEGMRDFGHYGSKDCVKLVFGIGDETSTTGQALEVSVSCSKTLGKKSRLLAFVQVLSGSQTVPDEVTPEDYIGANCRLLIQHKHTQDGRTFANVAGISPPEMGAPKLTIPSGFRRSIAVPTPAPAPEVIPRKPHQSVPAPTASRDADLKANIARVRANGRTPFSAGSNGPAEEEGDAQVPLQ
jgi:hypothetical protein